MTGLERVELALRRVAADLGTDHDQSMRGAVERSISEALLAVAHELVELDDDEDDSSIWPDHEGTVCGASE